MTKVKIDILYKKDVVDAPLMDELILPSSWSVMQNDGGVNVTGNDIEDDTITADNIEGLTITASEIAAATITATQIANATITGAQIANATIEGSNIANATIAGSNIDNATIEAANIANATITATQIENATITTTEIANATIIATNISGTAAITGSQLAAAAGIVGTQIANTTITGGNLVNNTIGATQIELAAITGSLIANSTIEGGNIANNTITATQIAAATITGSEIANTTISGDNVINNTITIGKVSLPIIVVSGTFTDDSPDGSSVAWSGVTIDYNGTTYTITNGNTNLKYIWWDFSLSTTTFQTAANLPTLANEDVIVATNTAGIHKLIWNATDVSGDQIAAGTITGANIAATTINGSNIANNTIEAGQIANATITGTEIAGTTIAGSNIVNNTISATQIANATITTTQISGSAAITGGQIATGTITSTNITNATITGTDIATGTITGTHIQNASIAGTDIGSLTIAASNIANLTITAGKIANATITDAQIGSLSATKITAGTMNAARISGGDINGVTITGVTITGGTVQTSASGQRIVMSSDVLTIYSSNGSAGAIQGLYTGGVNYVNLTGPMQVNGEIVAGGMCRPSATNVKNLGSNSFFWNDLFIRTVKFDYEQTDYISQITNAGTSYIRIQFNSAGGRIGFGRSIYPITSNGYYCGISTNYWHRVYSDSYWTKNATFQMFDKYDDMQILRDIKFDKENKLIIDDLPEEMQEEGFINCGGMSSFMLCASKKIVETVDTMEKTIKELKGRLLKLETNKIT